MASIHPFRRRPSEPAPLEERAMDNLRFIRQTMEGASSFTAVPGWGGVILGATALPAAWAAGRQTNVEGWITTWLVEALLAGVIAGWAMDR